MKAKRSCCDRPTAVGWAAMVAATVAAVALAAVPRAWAEEGEVTDVSAAPDPVIQAIAPMLQGMGEKVSLDLRGTEVGDALKYLATKGGLNIAISKNVSGRANLLLTDVPIRDVFDIILRSNELAYDKQGDVYSIMTEAEYRALYGKRFADLRSVETFRLSYAVPEQAFNLLDTLKSEIGRLLVDEDSGTVLVMDTPEKLREMEEAMATLEESGTVRVFDLKYAKAKDLEERLKDQVELKKLGYVKADERSNQLIVKTFPNRLKEVEQLVLSLDRQTREVLIDAKILKVNLTKDLNTGIDWNQIFANLTFHGLDSKTQNVLDTDTRNDADFRVNVAGTAPSETPAVTRLRIPALKVGSDLGSSIKFGDLLFGTISRDGYELFRFLETYGHTKIISNPRILAVENQEARIHVGTREAYVTTTTTTGQTTTTTAEEVEFLDVGIQLLVTPVNINTDGFVTMKIKPEVSSVVRFLTTPSGNRVPIVDTSTAETSVMVKDGSTVIIGGLRKDQKAVDDDQVPVLGNLPLLGEAFKQRDHSDELAELVVFITPHIVYGDQLVTGDETQLQRIKPLREYDAPRLPEPAPVR